MKKKILSSLLLGSLLVSTAASAAVSDPIKVKITISRFTEYQSDKTTPEDPTTVYTNDFAVPDKNIYYYNYRFSSQDQLIPLNTSTTTTFDKILRENNTTEAKTEFYQIRKNGVSLNAKVNNIFSDLNNPNCTISRNVTIDYSVGTTMKYEDKAKSTVCPYYYRFSAQLLDK